MTKPMSFLPLGVDLLLEPFDLPGLDLQLGVLRRGQLGAQIEQFLLDAGQLIFVKELPLACQERACRATGEKNTQRHCYEKFDQ